MVVFGRWAMLVRAIDQRVSARTAILLGFIGYVFNIVIPGAVGGDVIKAAYLARMQIRRTQAIASMLLDRVLGLLGLLLLAAIAGSLAWSSASIEIRRLIVVAWSLLATGLLLFTILFVVQPIWNFARTVSLSHPRLSESRDRVGRDVLRLSRTHPGLIATGLVLSVLSHGLTVVVFYLLGKALFGPNMHTSLNQHFLMVPLTLLTTALPLPFGALGLSEEVGSQLLGMAGHPSGTVVMLGLRVLMIVFALEGAGVCLARWKDLRALTEGGAGPPDVSSTVSSRDA